MDSLRLNLEETIIQTMMMVDIIKEEQIKMFGSQDL